MKAEPCNLLYLFQYDYEYQNGTYSYGYTYSLYEPFDQDTRNYYSIWLMDPS